MLENSKGIWGVYSIEVMSDQVSEAWLGLSTQQSRTQGNDIHCPVGEKQHSIFGSTGFLDELKRGKKLRLAR